MTAVQTLQYVVQCNSNVFKVKDLNQFKIFCKNWDLTLEIVDVSNNLVKFSTQRDGYLTDRIAEEDENAEYKIAYFDTELLPLLDETSTVIYAEVEKGLTTVTKCTAYPEECEVLMLNDQERKDLVKLLKSTTPL